MAQALNNAQGALVTHLQGLSFEQGPKEQKAHDHPPSNETPARFQLGRLFSFAHCDKRRFRNRSPRGAETYRFNKKLVGLATPLTGWRKFSENRRGSMTSVLKKG